MDYKDTAGYKLGECLDRLKRLERRGRRSDRADREQRDRLARSERRPGGVSKEGARPLFGSGCGADF
jgi:hypothetical protein